jgi:hypothetical protein
VVGSSSIGASSPWLPDGTSSHQRLACDGVVANEVTEVPWRFRAILRSAGHFDSAWRWGGAKARVLKKYRSVAAPFIGDLIPQLMKDANSSSVQSITWFNVILLGFPFIPFSVEEKLSSQHWSPKQTRFGGVLVTGQTWKGSGRVLCMRVGGVSRGGTDTDQWWRRRFGTGSPGCTSDGVNPR